VSELSPNDEPGSIDEPVLDPDLRIVDAHYHVWPDTFSSITDHYGLASPSLLADTMERSGHNIVRGVHVTTAAEYDPDLPPALRPVAETRYLESEIAKLGRRGEHLISAMMGSASLQSGDAIQPLLDAHQAASPRFRGIRDDVAWDENPAVAHKSRPALLATPEALAAARHLADRDLSLEVWVYYSQLDDVVALAKAVPHLKMVLNHLGTPILDPNVVDNAAEVLSAWKASLRRLAEFETVTVKAGGLLMPSVVGRMWADRQPAATSEELAAWQRPVFETAIDAFSPSRTMFESNYPIDMVSGSYRTIWNSFKRIAAPYSPDEKADMFANTACRVYGIELEAAA